MVRTNPISSQSQVLAICVHNIWLPSNTEVNKPIKKSCDFLHCVEYRVLMRSFFFSPEVKKSKSFASTLKKRFARPKKSRSQSADRAQTSSLREGALLKPPSHQQQTQPRTDGDLSLTTSNLRPHLCPSDDLDQGEFADGRMRKSRSHSFSSSLRKLFKGGKKGSGRKDASRESSLSRASGRNDTSREPSIGMQNSPDLSYNNRDLTLRHTTPTPDYDQSSHPYSMSVPQNQSPLYDH